MGVARYGLLVSDRIIMNLDGTQNNGSAFLAFFTEILSFRKKILYSHHGHIFGHASRVPSPACYSGVSSIH